MTVSVRDLVEFILRTGDLGGSGRFASPGRALEGTRGHQREQRRRPADYQVEVSVKHEVDAGGFLLQIKGRVDGLLERAESIILEEIKTVATDWDGETDPLHWAQGKVYAYLCLLTREAWASAQVRLVYLDLATDTPTTFEQDFSREELHVFFTGLVEAYLRWARLQHEWLKTRDQSIQSLAFPFAHYRPGQRQLAVAVYRTIVDQGRLFAEAPTGIGKTMSVLLPAFKALGENRADKIFYLTAKTIGRTVAEQAVSALRHGGLQARVLTITAREKICFAENGPCDVRTCPYAIGYFDRLKEALWECLQREHLSRQVIEDVARRHQVCPFALSMDAAVWMDLVICDYNYVFDPRAYLRRFFSEASQNYILLVDEAHNLLERAREMFSAEMAREEVVAVRDLMASEAPECWEALGTVLRELQKLGIDAEGKEVVAVNPEAPLLLLRALSNFLEHAGAHLARNEPALYRDVLLQLYFRAFSFARTGEVFDHRYVTIVKTEGSTSTVRLFCLDPSHLLRAAVQRGNAVIFFSATLSPLDYFRDTLGGDRDDDVLRLGSPFPMENLGLLAGVHVATSFKQRTTSYSQVAQAINALIADHPGNYLVYFSSYAYLQRVVEAFDSADLKATLLLQKPGMTETERERFISEFSAERKDTLVGFAVLGGIFGEGIDLVGERLKGAVVVGVGLPQLSIERNLIRQYFEEKNGAGFEYAYVFPGMNRVLQAAGRVIRSETDRGMVLLLDTRFGEYRYRELFPGWWNVQVVTDAGEIAARARRFWNG